MLAVTFRVSQSATLSAQRLDECARIGALLARLRVARRIKQTDAALRALASREQTRRVRDLTAAELKALDMHWRWTQ